MSIQCPACDKQLSTDDGIPRFCSGCGTSLSGLIDPVTAEAVEPGFDEKKDTDGFEDITQAFGAPGQPSPPPETLAHDATKARNVSGDAILPSGTFVGPFKIQNVLGQGGMGTVYKAVHSESGQTVALKLLSKSVQSTDESIKRFQRESQVAASINHPRSTFVYQAGQYQGQFYITMELMTGGTLEDVVRKEKTIPMNQAVDYVLDMISGLKAAHVAGIVHRDLKPSNCFIDQTGRVKIGDFGLAKSFIAESSLTQTGTFMGTPQFAAPEQLRASDVDERADIYAIGGTLFYLLCGRAPFVGNAAQVIASIASDPPPKVSSLVSDVPFELSRIIHQTLEKDPARRPENLEELRNSLLPFSSRGATTADVGRRMAAFYLDNAVIFLIIMIIAQLFGVFSQLLGINDFKQVFFANIFFSFFISAAYFAFQEWRWGTTLGKWLFGMRVLTSGNRSPGLFAAVIRGAMVPGISYALNAIPAYLLGYDPEASFEAGKGIWSMIELQAISLLTWLPNVVCFFGAKMETGFRGFHEVITGTRVVRLSGALEYERPQDAPITTPLAIDSNDENQTIDFGDYQAIGLLGRRPSENSRVLLGRDRSLDRDVWIVENPFAMTNAERWEKRKSVARPTRLRILAEKTDDPKWVVTESVKGMPLADYIDTVSSVDWRSFRPLLRELSYELAKGEQDGTLPTRVGLSSVWVDQAGRVKLLDQPLIAAGRSEADFDPGQAKLSTFQLVTLLLDGFIARQIVPAHVLTFRRELEVLRIEDDALKKIGDRLGELSDKPSAWRWDDRLGALAITMGVEYSMALSLMTILAIVFSNFLQMSLVLSTILMFSVGTVTAILLGACFGGGPVFRVSGVLLRRNKTLEPSSAVRCGFRNWVAWLPVILTAVVVAVFIHKQIEKEAVQAVLETNNNLSSIEIAALLFAIPITIITFLGCVYAIFRPARGLPDLIAGTRLIRK